jgi:hypothetical protein
MARSNHVPHWSQRAWCAPIMSLIGQQRTWCAPIMSLIGQQRAWCAPIMSYHQAMNIFCCLMHRDLVCSSHTSRMALFPIGSERKSLLGLLSYHATPYLRHKSYWSTAELTSLLAQVKKRHKLPSCFAAFENKGLTMF